MSLSRFTWLAMLFLAGAEVVLGATLGVGSTKAEVLSTLGAPQGAAGNAWRAVFLYPEGPVLLRGGRVVSLPAAYESFRVVDPGPPGDRDSAEAMRRALAMVEENTPAPEPPTAPVAGTQDPAEEDPARGTEFRWIHHWEEARRRSATLQKPILAYFCGPDWEQGSRRFDQSAWRDPQVLDYVAAHYVPLRVATYRHRSTSQAGQQEFRALSERYGVAELPAFLILNSDGSLRERLEISPQGGDRMITEEVARVLSRASEEKPSAPRAMAMVLLAAVAGLLVLMWKVVGGANR